MESKPKMFYIAYTVLIFMSNFAKGIGIALIGATLVDLSFIYHTSINTISYITMSDCIGYSIGSLASFLYGWINRQLLLSIMHILFAISVGFLLLYGHLWLTFGMIGLGCASAGAWDSASSVWLVEMWPVRNSALILANQFMWGLGTVLAPLLASPFVYGKTNVTKDHHELTSEIRIKSLMVPFSITAVINIIVPIILLVMFFICRYEKVDHREVANDANLVKVAFPRKRLFKLILVGFCVAFYIAGQYGYVSFSTSMFQYLDPPLSATQASHVQSVLSATFTVGRLFAAFVSLKVPIDYILAYHHVIQICALLFLFWVRDNLTLIYVGSAALGFGFSAIWPSMFAFTEQHLGLTDRISSLFVLLVGCMSLIIPLVLTQVFKSHPLILFVLTGSFCVTSFALFLIVRFWIYFETNLMHNKYKVSK